ncbi:hypothetical protein AcW1_003136 [Taiwanofungus camphoratus]|nr:hypothetical protein AcV5_001671 [Antrodia cinnamomea]KAI0933215.1 hypothetical protein AcV7_004747 [Antrodia cinnamomea]KAI0942532.1 hypothetical protein AcW1_003136 [Antrodia cinnamomea]
MNLPHQRFTYLGWDYPQTWPLSPLATVHISRENSMHYALDTAMGLAEWNASLPSGGVLLHLGPTLRPFSLSMLHQLRCLDILREILVAFYADESSTAQVEKPHLAKHCMNYLRQMVLCRADTRLESVRAPKGHGTTVWEVTHVCKDWSAVLSAAEQNWKEYLEKVDRESTR